MPSHSRRAVAARLTTTPTMPAAVGGRWTRWARYNRRPVMATATGISVLGYAGAEVLILLYWLPTEQVFRILAIAGAGLAALLFILAVVVDRPAHPGEGRDETV